MNAVMEMEMSLDIKLPQIISANIFDQSHTYVPDPDGLALYLQKS